MAVFHPVKLRLPGRSFSEGWWNSLEKTVLWSVSFFDLLCGPLRIEQPPRDLPLRPFALMLQLQGLIEKKHEVGEWKKQCACLPSLFQLPYSQFWVFSPGGNFEDLFPLRSARNVSRH